MPNPPADYLTIGHLTKDLSGKGFTLGGTAAYASKTAQSFGLNTALATSCTADLDLHSLDGILLTRKSSQFDTTFENIETTHGRNQKLDSIAQRLTAEDIPAGYIDIPIIHIGPVADEVDENIISRFSRQSLIGITPQGWMRKRLETNQITYKPWIPGKETIERADSVIISIEDVQKDEETINGYAQQFKLLVVTEGFNGARVYQRGEQRHFSAPKMKVVDPTGAGDIFAAVFFIYLRATDNPWKAAEAAVHLASLSVGRKGLNGIPKPEEVQSSLMEIIKGSSSQ
jgi:hypothetical protein